MKRIVMMLLVLAVVGGTTEVNAQSWLKKLGEKATEAAKRKVEQKVEQKTEQAVDDVFEGNIGKGKKSNKKDKNNNAADNGNEVYDDGTATAPQNGGQQQGKSLEMTYAKSDFVPGDEIIFEDLVAGEQMGEFPSMWDLKSGNAEVATVGGGNAIHMGEDTRIKPYMKEKDYLPDVFTIEFDLYIPGNKGLGMNSRYDIELKGADGDTKFSIFFYMTNESIDLNWDWYTNGERNTGETEYYPFVRNDFNHFAISFNKRAMKAYVNGSRFANIPRCDAPTRFEILAYSGAEEDNRFIKNVRIAKGAVPLYDRMMSEGKFITYGITFDVGKSTIKPESMGEINRIVQLMNENPDLKFSVEGHTDSTGNAASNQTLSEARSQAIVAKLVEMGIAADRLTAVGKGQNNPIADNGTDEGRAKNRRVEFVKQ